MRESSSVETSALSPASSFFSSSSAARTLPATTWSPSATWGRRAGGNLVLLDDGIDVGDADEALAAVLEHLHDAVDLADDGLPLGDAGLEQLLDAGKTARDVGRAGDAAGVEGAHGELGARLADGLRRDDADGRARAHQLTPGEVAPVAELADAALGLAGHRGADVDARHLKGFEAVGDGFVDLLVAVDDDLAGGVVGHGSGGVAADDAVAEVLHRLALVALLDPETGRGLAVVVADDDVLGDVDQAAGEVAGIRRAEGGIGKALAGAVGGDEVLQHGEPLAEGRADGLGDDLAVRVGHEAAHPGHLPDLGDVALGAGAGHVVERAVLGEALGDVGLDAAGRLGPHLDGALVALLLGDEPHLVLILEVGDLLVGLGDELLLVVGHDDLVDGDGDAALRGEAEADLLDAVDDFGRRLAPELAVDEGDEPPQRGAVHRVVLEGEVLGEHLVEDDAADGRLQQPRLLQRGHRTASVLAVGTVGGGAVGAHLDGGAQVDGAEIEGELGLVEGCVDALRGGAVGLDEGAAGALANLGHVVGAEDHVEGGRDGGVAAGGRQQVLGGKQDLPGLGHGLAAEGHMHGHLVAVEIRIEGGADERVELDGGPLDEHRLEGLDAEPVEGGGAVEQHRAVLDHLVEDVPDLGAGALDDALGALDVVGEALGHERVHDERLEQLERHLLWAGRTGRA